jgi:valyl-tRNA synthetase
MRGDETLWGPGVDHAGIAAQFVLDKILAEEGESRQTLGRDRYLERMWQFIDETRDVIGQQFRRLGASADWQRTRFTMDEGSARAVRVAFKRLWDAGLVYRGEALVNWCPRCGSRSPTSRTSTTRTAHSDNPLPGRRTEPDAAPGAVATTARPCWVTWPSIG